MCSPLFDHRGLTAMITVALPIFVSSAVANDLYTLTNLGSPENADSAIGVRMNIHGHVAGYSAYYGQGEPSIRPWVWTAAKGFTILPPPPDTFLGRARAMDISDGGIVAGDGGFDAGLAWRYENGSYETFGDVGGMFIAYLGGLNEAGNVAGTARDSSFGTVDRAFLDVNGGGTILLTPDAAGGRGADVNELDQVCGYTDGGLKAFRWDEFTGIRLLGTLGLSYSFASSLNDYGDVVGLARSQSGNTSRAWIYSDDHGQQRIPTSWTGRSSAVSINNLRQVVGNTHQSPDFGWRWNARGGARMAYELYPFTPRYSAVTASDINDAGQILLYAYDNVDGDFRTLMLTPTGAGACCLADEGCVDHTSENECAVLGGAFQGPASDCAFCTPTGACCLTSGACLSFTTETDCVAQVGSWQGDGASCALVTCPIGVANDDCADAIALTSGDRPFSTEGATTDGPTEADACGGAFSFGQDIWFTYEAEGTGTLTVSTCNQANFDTKIALYTGTCDALDFVACSDNATGCNALTSRVTIPVACGDPVLLLRIGGASTSRGTGTLTLTFAGEPCAPSCLADLDGSGAVDFGDILRILVAWGMAGGPEDLDGSGTVNFGDLLVVLGAWGACP